MGLKKISQLFWLCNRDKYTVSGKKSHSILGITFDKSVKNYDNMFLPHDAMQNTVMPQYMIRLSVTFRHRDHIQGDSE